MNLNYSATISSSLTNVQSLLLNFLNHPQSQHDLLTAFGDDFNLDTGSSLIQSLATNDLTSLVNLEIVARADINNANGAYDSENNRIYLASELLDSGNIATITRVFLEEIGHYLDKEGNSDDAPGDEGAIFAALVLGEPLDSNQLALLKAEDDRATVTIEGETIDLEQMSLIYVNDDATGTNDGSSWENAYQNLQDALAAAVAEDEIWVAQGTYRPTSGTERDISFAIKDGVGVYGGFAGIETERTQRDVEQNVTILSGDIGTLNDNVDNTYNVVNISNTTDSTVLDGFVITDGNANNTTVGSASGGGIFSQSSSANLANLTIVDNNAAFGGGIFSNDSQLQITNVLFLNNAATGSGGALSNVSSSSTLSEVRFYGNSASSNGGAIYDQDGNNITLNNVEFKSNQAGSNGGAYYNGNTSSFDITNGLFLNNTANRGGAVAITSKTSTLVNTIFQSNIATDQGGAIYVEGVNDASGFNAFNNVFNENISRIGGAISNVDSAWTVVNSTLVNNQSLLGSAIASSEPQDNNPTITNSIIFRNLPDENDSQIANLDNANVIINDSLVREGYTGNNIITGSPRFVNINNFDFRLRDNSPALNQGNNDSIGGVTTDLAGNPRIVEDIVDLGAYEGAVVPPRPTIPQLTDNPSIIYVNAAATGENNGNSWDNAFTGLQDAIDAAEFGSQIWVASGVYKPSDNDRDASFNLVDAVAIYGGFAGGESNLNARDAQTNVTILSGDIGIAEDSSDNSYHVVDASSTTNSTILDGFTIQDGNADGTEDNSFGGGIYAVQSNAVFQNLVIANNNANSGGGFYSEDSLNQIINVTFANNSSVSNGGAVALNTSNSLFANTLFRNNNTSGNGGAIYNNSSSPIGLNNTFASNQGANGAAVYSEGTGESNTQPTFYNSIFWGNTGTVDNAPIFNNGANTVVSNSIVEGGYDGLNILDSDPLYVDLVSGDFRLKGDSPGIDAGDNDLVNGRTDLANSDRIFNNIVDLGAYEYFKPFLTISDVEVVVNTTTANPTQGGEASFVLQLVDSVGDVVSSESEISIDYQTLDDTAIVDEDYLNTSGTVTFAPGETTQTVTVPVLNNLETEEIESFILELSNPSEDLLDFDTQGVATITDITLKIANISINDATVIEGDDQNTTLEFTVSLDEAALDTVTVDYTLEDDSAIAEVDYTGTSGTITFEPGVTEQTISVTVLGDLIDEDNETLLVNLSNPSSNAEIADATATGTIEDNDDPVLTPLELFRFRNITFDTGTYVFVAEQERDAILNNPDFNQTFVLEGNGNPAFIASSTPTDETIPFFRLSSNQIPGTFLFVSTPEYDAIFAEGSDQLGKWEKQGFDENGNDIAEFHLYPPNSGLGTLFNRYQNRSNGTFLYAGPAESDVIDNNPDFSNAFFKQGGAFESI